MNKKITLLICVAIPLLTGGLSGWLSADGISGWFQTLNKPSFNPPSWLFGPVWSILYIVMGISLFMIWQNPVSIHRRRAIRIFIVQLILNFFWSIIFFRWHLTGIAAVEILILWLTIILMIRAFIKISPVAGYMQIPYLIWVSFASLLSLSFWYLN